jgi:hypothetical protein
MRNLARAVAIALIATAGGFGLGVHPAVAAAAGQGTKVVIVVGATQGATGAYRADADIAASEFAKFTTNVVKVYSPNATWANVVTAAQGASILVYMGHGSGYPNPYNSYLKQDGDNGMGLNYSDGSKPQSDSYTQYYGENYMAQLGLAPNAVVILNHLCYASGDSEGGTGLPTLSVAQTRVDGYASGFLRGNARAVIAEGINDLSPYVDALFTKTETIDQMWKAYTWNHGNFSSWASTRSSGYTSQIDPDYAHPQSDGDVYYRSMVSAPGLSTTDVGQVKTYAATTYHQVTPVRMLDTRYGIGLPGRLVPNTPATFQITGRNNIPANATAVTGNVTVVDPSDSWAIYLGPDPIPFPGTSSINFAAGQNIGNGLTVALSSTGSLSATYMANAGRTTDLVFDLTGYFTPDTSGATFHAMAPTRLLDTRSGNGLNGKLLANTPATFQVTGRGDIPSGATAVTGNVTVVNSTFSWAIYLGPDVVAYPGTSSLNFDTGEIRGNSMTVMLGQGGTLSATYMSNPGNTTDLVFDVTGYYTADLTGLKFVPLTPARVLDTRYSNGLPGKLAANTPATFSVIGRGGIPAAAKAVAGNVTVVNETNSWLVFLGPDPQASPQTSTINFLKGDIRGNSLAVALSSTGTLSATYASSAGNTTDLVLDLTGYFVP